MCAFSAAPSCSAVIDAVTHVGVCWCHTSACPLTACAFAAAASTIAVCRRPVVDARRGRQRSPLGGVLRRHVVELARQHGGVGRVVAQRPVGDRRADQLPGRRRRLAKLAELQRAAGAARASLPDCPDGGRIPPPQAAGSRRSPTRARRAASRRPSDDHQRHFRVVVRVLVGDDAAVERRNLGLLGGVARRQRGQRCAPEQAALDADLDHRRDAFGSSSVQIAISGDSPSGS